MHLRFTTAGESHGKGLVVIVEGIPAGLPIGGRRGGPSTSAAGCRGTAAVPG